MFDFVGVDRKETRNLFLAMAAFLHWAGSWSRKLLVPHPSFFFFPPLIDKLVVSVLVEENVLLVLSRVTLSRWHHFADKNHNAPSISEAQCPSWQIRGHCAVAASSLGQHDIWSSKHVRQCSSGWR